VTGLAFALVAAYAVTVAGWLAYRLVWSRRVETALATEIAIAKTDMKLALDRLAQLEALLQGEHAWIVEDMTALKKRLEKVEFRRVV
jgi:hypothetical protein